MGVAATTTKDDANELDLRTIRDLDLFQGVSPRVIEDLLRRCPRRIVKAGEVLIAASSSNRQMYRVLAGQLEVTLGATDDDVIATMGPGETTGEISAVDQRPASATVRSVCESRLLVIDLPTFWSLLGDSHAFAVNLILKLAARVRGGNRAMNEIARLRTQFERAALYDALTGVPNRRWLDQTLLRLVERNELGRESLCVAMIDIDHFKRFNDDHGHQAGDRVLTRVARTLVEHLRPTDLFARVGGEEFVAIFPNTDTAGATIAAERLLASAASLRVVNEDGTSLPAVTISIGLARAEPGQKADALLGACDAALYRAKDSGRNRVCS